MIKLAVRIGEEAFDIDMRDTPTCRALAAALPFQSRAETWGEEVYFGTPVSAALEDDALQVVQPGTVCFWTEGNALALPFGRTPLSLDERPKLASRCNIVGRLAGDPRRLAKVRSGQIVKVQKA